MCEAIRRLREEGKYYQAGAMSRKLGKPRHYGCHVGMRSTLVRDRGAFYAGWDDYDMWLEDAEMKAKVRG